MLHNNIQLTCTFELTVLKNVYHKSCILKADVLTISLQNRYGFLLKLSNSIFSSLGSSFQYFEPTTLKLLSANVFLLVNGTISFLNLEFERVDLLLVDLQSIDFEDNLVPDCNTH